VRRGLEKTGGKELAKECVLCRTGKTCCRAIRCSETSVRLFPARLSSWHSSPADRMSLVLFSSGKLETHLQTRANRLSSKALQPTQQREQSTVAQIVLALPHDTAVSAAASSPA
jgi:hypothetical protein